MIILAARAPATFEAHYRGNAAVGHLLTPRSRNVRAVLASGRPWAVDAWGLGDAGSDRYLRLFGPALGRPACLFFGVPPTESTWHDRLARHGLPIAPVLQPGWHAWTCFEPAGVAMDWERIGGIVLGGDPWWQRSADARRLVEEAHLRRLWVHARDVAGAAQARYLAELGVESCSLPHFGRFAYHRFDPLVQAAQAVAGQRLLFGR